MDTKELIAALEAWAPMVSSGYEVPAAGQVMFEAARRLEAMNIRILELEAEIEEFNEMQAFNGGM